MPPNILGEILAICQAMDLLVIMDEIYAPLTFDEKPQTVLALNDEALVVSGFSKYFGMTGLRLGWAIVPEFLLDHLETIAQNLYIAPPTPAQYAAMAAFLPETLDELENGKGVFKQGVIFWWPIFKPSVLRFPFCHLAAFIFTPMRQPLPTTALTFVMISLKKPTWP